MEYLHYSNFCSHSPFSKLSGNYQRAIETQANIDLEARKVSKTYQKSFTSDAVQLNFFNKRCDYYAQKGPIELKRLAIFCSKAIYFFPLSTDRMTYYKNKAYQQSLRIDLLAASMANQISR